MSAEDSRYHIQIIRLQLLSKEIDYKEARALATPHLNTLNEIGRKIAKKYKKPYYPLSFKGLMR